MTLLTVTGCQKCSTKTVKNFYKWLLTFSATTFRNLLGDDGVNGINDASASFSATFHVGDAKLLPRTTGARVVELDAALSLRLTSLVVATPPLTLFVDDDAAVKSLRLLLALPLNGDEWSADNGDVGVLPPTLLRFSSAPPLLLAKEVVTAMAFLPVGGNPLRAALPYNTS